MSQQSRESGLSIAIRQTMNSDVLQSTIHQKNISPEFTIKIANTLEERESVFHLGYQVYLEKGYIKENPNQWLVQSYDVLNQTTILIVQDKNKKIAGSLTLVFDENGKLPVEKIYGEETRAIRLAGSKIMETSRLVISQQYRNEKIVLQLLLNYMLIYTYHVKNYTSMLIQVNPRHKAYYKSLLKYDEIGIEKSCPSVQNAPAVLLHLPLNRYQEEINRYHNMSEQTRKERSLYPYFLKPAQEKLVAQYLKNQFKPMTAEEKLYFGFSESGIRQALCV